MRTTKRTPVAASRRPPIAFACRVPIRSYRLRYNRMAIPPAVLTGAARIRDAAWRQLAARGVAAASIRHVAKAAGVSPGLVQHHCRSKAGRRRAVDACVMRRAVESFGDLITEGSPEENARKLGSRIAAFIRANPAVFAYIGRSLLEADAPGRELFDRLLLVARARLDRLFGERLLRKALDRELEGLFLFLIQVGVLFVWHM